MLQEFNRYDIYVYHAHFVIGHCFHRFLNVGLHLVRYIGTAYLAVHFDIDVRVDSIAHDITADASAADRFDAAYFLRSQTDNRTQYVMPVRYSVRKYIVTLRAH